MRGEESFSIVDDDLSVRSEGQCLLKLNIFSDKGFSHCRIIKLAQIVDKDLRGTISYPMLMDLIKSSSGSFVHNTPSMPDFLSVWCTYKDDDGQSVLIGTSEELQYAIKTQGNGDIMTIKVEIVCDSATDLECSELDFAIPAPNPDIVSMENVHQEITKSLETMEERLSLKISGNFDLLKERLHTIEESILQAQKHEEEEVFHDEEGREVLTDPPGQTPVQEPDGLVVGGFSRGGSQLEDSLILMEQGRAPSNRSISVAVAVPRETPTSIAEVTAEPAMMAECQWVQPATSFNRRNSFDSNGTAMHAQIPGVETANEEDVVAEDEVFDNVKEDVSRLEDLGDRCEALLLNVNNAIPVIEDSIKKMTADDDKRKKEMDYLRDDLQAQACQFEEWNRTVMDGFCLQTKTLTNRMNGRTEKILNRMTQLESYCRDLHDKTMAKKHWKALQKMERDQAKLRKDIATLIKALVKEADKEDCSIKSDDTVSSKSVYTSVPPAVKFQPSEGRHWDDAESYVSSRSEPFQQGGLLLREEKWSG